MSANHWVKNHKDLIVEDVELGYKPDRYTEDDIRNCLNRFGMDRNHEKIGYALYDSILDFALPFYMKREIPPDQIEKEIEQIEEFCKLGEYGSYIEWDFVDRT